MKKIILLSILSLLLFAGCGLIKNNIKSKTELTAEEAKERAEEFVKKNLTREGADISVKEITEDGGLYKMIMVVDNNEYSSYMTKDGGKFFPQAFDIKEMEEKKPETRRKNDRQRDIIKSEKPKVDLFVMSYCPYGNQMEKGILPVAELLSDKIDFQIKFCDYAMHGKKEIDEELNQYCVQKGEPEKFMNYLRCFLGEGKSESCVKEAKIDSSKMRSCVAATDKNFKITEKYNDKELWKSSFPPFDLYKDETIEYGVKGSPSLIINGIKVSSGRSPAALLTTICSAFENPPKECGQELSSSIPSPGFGFDGGGGNGANASCN